jgi:hypothetical protein
MVMNEDIGGHLELVQGIITRMATNSFLLKGWSITLVAALFALAEKDTNLNFAILALFPALSFWGLDAYYLRQERLFRKLYRAICSTGGEGLQPIPPFSLDTINYQGSTASWFKTLWSPTIVMLHGAVIALVITVIIVTKFLS